MPTADMRVSPAAGPSIAFDEGLVRKYDGFGPRYTSYPTADRFHDGFTAAAYVDELAMRPPRAPLSLYVHIPFCNTICYYCACNKIVTRNRGHAVKYVDYLAREIEIVCQLAGHASPVLQIHWGGGTPTFLSRLQMAGLMGTLHAYFAFAHDAEISIEVDPRKVDEDTVGFLGEIGFNRISIGIQDFDPAVQAAVNRIQSEAETRVVIDAARESGFTSVNTDLIYGLPRQTVAGFAATLDKVIAAGPDRIALYSYAHVPHLFKSQRNIAAAELPAPEVKLAILALAIDRLGAAGYGHIGMDHFAKPDDELAVAQREHKLHRNFQGYSTKPDCDLLAFGISAIGKVGPTYVQNVKTLDEYYERLDAGALPVLRGTRLTRDDLVRRDVIQKLMCDFELDFDVLSTAHDLPFGAMFAPELTALAPLVHDGLVELSAHHLRVTPRGRLLVRAVAMTFDRYLREGKQGARYSRVI
jgi:oxygen-independent coproporphyrinogen III oxidase